MVLLQRLTFQLDGLMQTQMLESVVVGLLGRDSHSHIENWQSFPAVC